MTATPSHLPGLCQRAIKALALALAASVAIALTIMCASVLSHEGFGAALRSTTVLQARKLLMPIGPDSWAAMSSGLRHLRESPGASPYRLALEQDHCKFQYPPSSLLLLELVGTPDVPVDCKGAHLDKVTWSAIPWMSWAERLALLGTILFSVLILERVLAGAGARDEPASQRNRWWLRLLGFGVGLTFYPLLRGYELGQVQILLNLLSTLALWSMLRGQHAWAGALIGLCCLFKPQYALMLVWAAWRRDWRFMLAMAVVGGAGLLAALLRYGLDVHLQYIDTLRMLSRHGEAYWANQTINGFLNRLLGNGDALNFSHAGFSPYHALVYWGTLASSALIMVGALWPARSAEGDARALDFAVMLAALVIASPIGWEHHYGGFLPLFALTLGLLLRRPVHPQGRGLLLLLGLSHAAVANELLRPELMLVNPFVGMLASHLLLGALLLLGLMLTLRRRASLP